MRSPLVSRNRVEGITKLVGINMALLPEGLWTVHHWWAPTSTESGSQALVNSILFEIWNLPCSHPRLNDLNNYFYITDKCYHRA